MKNIDNVVCYNDIELIKNLNNKPKCRRILEDVVKILDYKYLNAKEIDYNHINNLFENKFEKYVVQQPVGFGGVGTFILGKSDKIHNVLNSKIVYSVSGYIENAKSINNTFMISDNYIHIFDGSFQIIVANKELEYDGWDFEAYKKLSKSIKDKIYKQTFKIAEKLKSLGYRGIGGVDYLLKDDQLYFMEINPRFQASSEELDKMLVKKGCVNIFELNYLSFYNEVKFIEICKGLTDNGRNYKIKN